MPNRNRIKSAFESMMFVWGEPLDVKTAAEVVNTDKKTAYECFKELAKEYDGEGRGLAVRETDGAFRFVTRVENYDYLQRLCAPAKEKKLSQAALEVLAVIAYRQPVSKGEIDAIRGVKCERVVEGLMRKELVEEKGRSSAIGRPILYGTTRAFLRHFDLESIKDLPEIDDIEGAIHDRDEMDAPEDGAEQITFLQ
jgi:segregation and condensation protein B